MLKINIILSTFKSKIKNWKSYPLLLLFILVKIVFDKRLLFILIHTIQIKNIMLEFPVKC